MSDRRPVDPIAIDVGDLVQKTVASLYSHLITRPTGRAVRLAIEAQLADAGDQALSLIDLSEVTLLDFSCADEVVAKLLQRYQDHRRTDAYFVFRGVTEPHRDQIEVVLERQSLAAVAETGPGRFELLGSRSEEEGRLWLELEEAGTMPGRENGEGGDDGAAGTLQRLVARGLAYRSGTAGDVVALSRLMRHLG